MTKILIVEDDPILRDFLVQEAEKYSVIGVKEVYQASSISEGRTKLRTKMPNALLLDLNLPDGSGVELANEFHSMRPQGVILILTGQIHQVSIPLDLHPIIYSVINKSEGLAPLRTALRQMIEKMSDNTPNLSKLSPRQLEMLALLGEGLDTADIAKRLGITFSTAQTHRRQITSRLGIKGFQLIDLAKTMIKQS